MPPFPEWLSKLGQAEVCGILGFCGSCLLNSLLSVLPSTLCLLDHAGGWELEGAAAWAVSGSPDLEAGGAANHGSVVGSTVLHKGFPPEALRQPFSINKDGTP